MTTPIVRYLFKGNLNDEMGNYNAMAYGGNSTLSYEDVPNNIGLKGKVLVAKGSNEKFYIPPVQEIFKPTPRTIECWCFPTKLNYDTLWMQLFSNYYVSGNDGSTQAMRYLIRYYIQGSANLPLFWGGGGSTSFGTSAIPGNVWSHLVLVMPGNTTAASAVQMWRNGEQLTTSVSGSGTWNVASSTSNIYVGSGFEFKMADYRIYNQALSAAEIIEHYNRELSPLQTSSYSLLPRRGRDIDYLTKVRN